MKTKTNLDEKARHSQRNMFIKFMFHELTNHHGYSNLSAYAVLEMFFGLSIQQIITLLKTPDVEVKVSLTSVFHFSVILQRFSEELKVKQLKNV